jgi:hypothetical protein
VGTAFGAEETALDHDPLDLIKGHPVAPAIVELSGAGGRNLRAFGSGRIAEYQGPSGGMLRACNDSPSPQPRLAGGERVRRSARGLAGALVRRRRRGRGEVVVLGLRGPSWQPDGGRIVGPVSERLGWTEAGHQRLGRSPRPPAAARRSGAGQSPSVLHKPSRLKVLPWF